MRYNKDCCRSASYTPSVFWGGSVHIVPFRIGNVWLAIDAGKVDHILGKREWVQVPSAPTQWPGVLVWRGRAVAVLDLGVLLGMSSLSPSVSRHRTLIASALGSLLAIAVDEIREAQAVADSLLRPVHVTQHRYAAFELELDGQVMSLLDPVALVRDALAAAGTPAGPLGSPVVAAH